jgi:hypothetical protein
MNDYWPAAIGRQFAAAIQMLQRAIDACPDNLWDDRSVGTPFWHLAYHALFYADFYLSDSAEAFHPPDFHAGSANFLPGDYQQYGGIVTTPPQAFTKAQLLAYADHCLRKSDATFKRLTSERALERCGFPWYELSVAEFLLNNLRHTQHHTGQLALLLRRHCDIGIEWFGTKDNQPA